MTPEFIPAATVVILRQTAGGAPELLMIERAADMRFAGGALVFPGGRIDPGDHVIAASPALLIGDIPNDADDAAARVGAIRETIEEVGIAIGLHPLPEASTTAQIRVALAEGADFGALLESSGHRLDLGQLAPFARWCPDLNARNFDTRFYLAAAPETGIAEADGSESIRSLWISAASALADADEGHHRIIFPTRRNLERLATFASIGEAIADGARYGSPKITPRIEERDGEQWLFIPDDCGYPVIEELLEIAMRA